MSNPLGWLSSVFNRGRVAPADPYQPAWSGMFVPPELRLTPEEQLNVSVVWAAIRNIVDPIASSTVSVFTMDEGGRKKLDNEALVYLLNVRPNPDLTAQAFKEILLTEALVTGNGYAEIVRDRAGRIAELWPIPSDSVRVMRNASGLIYEVNVATKEETKAHTLLAKEVLHIRGPCVRGFLGDSAVYRAAKAIALHVAQEQFASAYFINNTVLGGTLEVPGSMKDETKKLLAADWKAKFGGKKKAHGVAVLEGGAKFVPFEVDADKAQLVPSRAFSVEDISRYFGVPLMRLGVQSAAVGYGSNVAQTNLQFSRDTLTPWVNRLCEELAYKCYPERSPWRTVDIDLAWMTLGDSLERAQAYEVLIRSGVKTVNECRTIEGDNNIGPEGDLHLIQSGLLVLDEENLQKPEPPTLGPPGGNAEDGKDPEADPKVDEAMNRFRTRANARTADLRAKGHDADTCYRHVTELAEKALGDFPSHEPAKVRAALLSIAAGSSNAQAKYCLAAST